MIRDLEAAVHGVGVVAIDTPLASPSCSVSVVETALLPTGAATPTSPSRYWIWELAGVSCGCEQRWSGGPVTRGRRSVGGSLPRHSGRSHDASCATHLPRAAACDIAQSLGNLRLLTASLNPPRSNGVGRTNGRGSGSTRSCSSDRSRSQLPVRCELGSPLGAAGGLASSSCTFSQVAGAPEVVLGRVVFRSGGGRSARSGRRGHHGGSCRALRRVRRTDARRLR